MYGAGWAGYQGPYSNYAAAATAGAGAGPYTSFPGYGQQQQQQLRPPMPGQQ
jgi:hypothetical protein